MELNNKVVSPAFVHFEQGTDLSKDYHLMVSFDEDLSQDATLVFEPKFPALGKLKYKFKKELISLKPSLKKG